MAFTGFFVYVILFVLDLVICVPVYTAKKYNHSSRTNKLVWKGICIGVPTSATVIYVCLMLIYRSENSLWAAVIALGMLLCAVGDIVLEIRFVIGGVLFFSGHLCYVLGMLIYRQWHVSVVTLLCFLITALTGTVLTLKKLGKKHRFYLISYNLMISASLAMAVTQFSDLFGTFDIESFCVAFDYGTGFLGVGIIMLVASDWLLARNRLFGSNYWRSFLTLILYFGGQILIASNIMQISLFY